MAQQGGSSSGSGSGTRSGSSSSSSSPTTSPTKPTAEMKVLVVDDEPVVRMIHKALLGKVGIKDVTFAVNGKAAVDLHHSGASFDLILMDMQMPVMDGAQATKALRAMGVKKPIVGVTSLDAASRTAFMASGLDDCVSKPLTIEQISKHLKLQRSSPTKPKFQLP